MRNLKQEIEKLRALIETELAPRRQCFRNVTIFAGQPITPEQQAAIDYNLSLTHWEPVGFALITIALHPPRQA